MKTIVKQGPRKKRVTATATATVSPAIAELPNVCPKCGAVLICRALPYTDSENHVCVEWACESCNARGRAWYKMVFEKHYIYPM